MFRKMRDRTCLSLRFTNTITTYRVPLKHIGYYMFSEEHNFTPEHIATRMLVVIRYMGPARAVVHLVPNVHNTCRRTML